MTDLRAVLTDREREILETNGEDVTEKYYGVVITRVRKKIQRLGDDIAYLREHPTLADELREVVDANTEPKPDRETSRSSPPPSQSHRE
mgnify:CR=1 FL=1|jgi:hypothetical protein